MGVKKVAAFVIAGSIALYILYSLLPSIFSLYAGIDFTNAPTGSEPIVGATITIFVALVLWTMWNEMA